MLAELLEGARDRLLRPAGEEAPDGGRRALLDELIADLRRGRAGEGACPARRGLLREDERQARERLRRDVVAEAERAGAAVPIRELLIVSDWSSRVERDEVRERNRRLSSLLDAIDDSVILISYDDRIAYANRRARERMEVAAGRPLGDVVGKRPAELGVPPDRLRRWQTERPRIFAGETLTAEVLAATLPTARWHENVITPVRDDDGSVGAVAFVGRDIHERKLVVRRLELLARVSTLVGLRNDDLLQSIARLSIPELADWSAVDLIEADGVKRSFLAQRDPDKAALRDAFLRFGAGIAERWRRELATGRSVLLAAITDDDLRARATSEEQYQLSRSVGPRSAILVPITIRGRLCAMMSFVTTEESGRSFERDDVVLAEELGRRATQLLETAALQEELRASEERFRIGLAGSKIAVFEQDRELRYRWAYNAFSRVDAVGKKHEDIFPPDTAAELTRIKQSVLDTGEPVRQEVVLTTPGGERGWCRVWINPVRDESGDIVGIIGAATDVSDDKRMQDALAQAVTFREQMMSVLGHDLRNPLTAIKMSAARLRRRADVPATAREQAGRIDHAAGRMAELIATLLDFANARFRGALPIAPGAADLGRIARETVDELRAVRPDRAIELSVRGDARGQWDSARIAQVVSNLVANALEHGVEGAPVDVSVRDEGDAVGISVHNAGTPIPPELLPVLFEPFTRGSNGAAARGLGLGLYIAHEIVSAHGGVIEVVSTPGDGTRFTVHLPRRRALERAMHASDLR